MNVEQTASLPAVTGAIRQAARATGADFKYLLATAQVESNLDPNAQAPTSSARGLFQFIEQTWLGTLKEVGAALGYAPYANAISRRPSGEFAVADPRMYDRIMELRADPQANALMAGAYTRANAGKLAERLGRQPAEGELYIAHFMGASGAARLIEVARDRPYTPAAAVFPVQARANPGIFFDARGNARAAAEVVRSLVGRYGVARGQGGAAPGGPADALAISAANAAAGVREQGGDSVARAPNKPMVMPEQAAFAPVPEGAAAALAKDNGPVFHGLFRSGGNEPVSPLVSALWGAQAQVPAAPPAPAVAPPVSEAAPPVPAAGPPGGAGALDLFQEQVPDARALFRGRV